MLRIPNFWKSLKLGYEPNKNFWHSAFKQTTKIEPLCDLPWLGVHGGYGGTTKYPTCPFCHGDSQRPKIDPIIRYTIQIDCTERKPYDA